MNILLVLSFKGSCVLAGYYVLCLLLGKAFSHRMRYFWLKISLISYLLPLYWLRKEYVYTLQNKFGIQLIDVKTYYNLNYDKKLIRYGDTIIRMSRGLQKELLFVFFWFGIALIVLGFQMIKSHKRYKKVFRNSEAFPDGWLYEQFSLKERGDGLDRKVKLYLVDGNYCCSGGLFAPFIVMKKGTETDGKYILKHELTHIRRRDSLFKVMMYLALCIHWFNPLVYLLKRQMERECELSCDDRVVENYSMQERADYAKALVKSSLEQGAGEPLVSYLGKNKNLLKERIENIMDIRGKNRGKAFLCAALMAVILFGSSFTVLAYDHIEVEECTANLPLEGAESAEGYFTLDDEEDPFLAYIPKIVYVEQFVDEAGNVFDLSGEPQTYADCTHQYTSGKTTSHIINQSGGCTLTIYKAQRCTKCGNIVQGEIISTVNSPVCYH